MRELLIGIDGLADEVKLLCGNKSDILTLKKLRINQWSIRYWDNLDAWEVYIGGFADKIPELIDTPIKESML